MAVAMGALLGATALTPLQADNHGDQNQAQQGQQMQSQDGQKMQGGQDSAMQQEPGLKEYNAGMSGMDLSDWDSERLAGSWQADELIEEADVYGPNGEEVGEVEDIIIGPDNKVVSVIVEGGGFWDIGDTHFSVPWNEVEIVGYDRVNVPVTEETVEDYDMARDMDDEFLAKRKWRVSELINDYAVLKGGERFGYVNDVLIGENGEISAVLLDGTTDYGYEGPYAMPYYGYDYGWRPGYDRYQMGHEAADLENVPVMSEGMAEPFWES
jgi:sporulation protein YlmC with PRC-barrel domain